MEEPLKEYMAKQMIGHHLKFRCDCIVSMNTEGVIKDYSIVDNEIIFLVQVGTKIIKIGENHPKMKVTKIS